MKIFNKQAGETIVEVLFAIVVISSALGGAFAIANRSQLTVEANRERYQAQMLANSQADNLKLVTSDNEKKKNIDENYVSKQAFCIFQGSVYATDDSSGKCQFNFLGGVSYKVSITSNGEEVFLISVNWDSLINKEKDQVELVYGI